MCLRADAFIDFCFDLAKSFRECGRKVDLSCLVFMGSGAGKSLANGYFISPFYDFIDGLKTKD